MKRGTSVASPESSKINQSSRKSKNNPEKEGKAVRKKRKVQQRSESPKETTALDPKIVKISVSQRAKWQLLPNSTRLHLESMMDRLIVSISCENSENHQETERHLKFLKERLLKRFEALKVPVEKMSHLQNAHKDLAKEKKKSRDLEEELARLQEEIDEGLKAATVTADGIQSFQNKVKKLKHELLTGAEKADEAFPLDESYDLGLPDLSNHSLEAPLLQERFLKIQNQERILNYLSSDQMIKMRQKRRMKAKLRSRTSRTKR